MMPIAIIVAIAIAVVIAVFLGVVALQPEDFKLSRSATMAAAPGEVFAQVNDFHRWDNWSPWAKMDVSMKTTHEGPAAGEGAVYGWSGNNKVGEGKMTLLQSRPPELIRIKLEFFRPMRAVNTTEFTFKPEGPGTLTTWTMTGKNGFLAKAFHLFMNIDKMVGRDFEKGLAQLKALVETT